MKILLAIVLIFTITAIVLLAIQSRFIYFPRKYETGYIEKVHKDLIFISYSTDEGGQVAFYLPPRNKDIDNAGPDRVWVFFGGNANLALDWLGFIERSPHKNDGFLMIDYPGYGVNEGDPSPSGILESSSEAFSALADTLQIGTESLKEKLGVVGHSLGAAAGLDFAVKYSVKKLLLIAPFTTMHDMAVLMVGYPFCYVLLHRFDNVHRLKEITKMNKPPHIVLIHGDMDDVIPVTMSRKLAKMYKDDIQYIEIEGQDHINIRDNAEEVFADM